MRIFSLPKLAKKWDVIFLTLILLANFLFSFWLFHFKAHGYYSLHGDDENRSLIAYSIYKHKNFPQGSLLTHLGPGGFFPHWIWLPFQFWFNGFMLGIVKNPMLISFVTNSLFSLGIALILFFLIKILSSGERWLSFAGVVWYLSIPYFRRINLSGLDLTILHFFILAGIYSWLKYETGRKTLFLIFSAVLFLFGSMVRYEGWFYVGAFEIILFSKILRKETAGIRKYLILASVIPLLFIIIWLVNQKICFGHTLFLSSYRKMALIGIGQEHWKESIIFKMMIYPALVYKVSPLLIWLALPSLIFMKKQVKYLFPYVVFILIELLLLSASAVYGGVPYGPERVISTNVLLLLPLATIGILNLFRLLTKRSVALLFSSVLLLGLAINNFKDTPQDLKNDLSDEFFKIGHILKWSVDNEIIKKGERILLEEQVVGEDPRVRWDTFKLTLFAPDHAICDRDGKVIVKDNKEYSDPQSLKASLFNRPSKEVLQSTLDMENIRIAVVSSEENKRKLSEIFRKVFSTSRYTIFVSLTKSEVEASIKQLFLSKKNLYGDRRNKN